MKSFLMNNKEFIEHLYNQGELPCSNCEEDQEPCFTCPYLEVCEL